MKHLLIANWKMNPASLDDAIKLAKEEDMRDIIIAPPVGYLPMIAKTLKKSSVASQDIDFVTDITGPFTGVNSAGFIKKSGARYAIIGHSERRIILGESNADIAKKVHSALSVGITPIVCVGENAEIRASGYTKAREFVLWQLEESLALIKGGVGKLIIAYEPVWAISTNNTSGEIDDAEGAGEMIQSIKAFLSESMKLWAQYKVLGIYGGSVGVNNIGIFLKERSIDGFLVGGASLRAKEFKRIAEAVFE